MSDIDLTPPVDDEAAAASAANVAQIYAELSPERLEADRGVTPTSAVDDETLGAQTVDVLLVCHNGERWLPRVLEALGSTDVPLGSVTAVDTGSVDTTPRLLAQASIVDAMLTLQDGTGFTQAVAAAAAHVRERAGSAGDLGTAWYWVLHDDSAPHPDTLRRLLEAAVEHGAAVVGPKVLSWDRRRQLIEMGVTITGSGRRHTGLERREYDQGQHDDRLDVLAVGSAGMLVRADAWRALDGFDPQIPLFRDDVDFGWRAHRAGYRVIVAPAARMEHAEAAAHGRRAGGPLTRHPHISDRANAVYVLVANATPAGLLWAWPRAALGSLLRAVGFMLGKVPGLAYDEVVALGRALRPARLRAGRRWRRAQPRTGSVRGLRPTAGHQARQAIDNFTGLLAGTGAGQDVPGARRRAAPGVPDSEQDDEPLPSGESLLLKALTTPGLLLLVGMTVLTLLAGRGLLGPGSLLGGALLPAPGAAGALWETYLAGWHPVGVGTGEAAPPYLAALTAASLPLLGASSLLVTALLLLAVPLASFSAWRAQRGLVASRPVRLWAAVTYGVVLLGSGALSAGRLGTAVSAVLAPALARAVVRALQPDAAWRLAWSAALLLAVTAAFTPVVWPVAAVVAAVVAVSRLSAAVAGRWAVLVLTPAALLLPWLPAWVARPEMVVSEPGRAGTGAELAAANLPSWAPLLLHPGGPGALALGVFAAVPLLALLALLALPADASSARRAAVRLGWVLALVGLAAAVLTSRTTISASPDDGVSAGWPGASVMLTALGMLVALAVAADSRRTDGRTVVIVGATVLALGTTVVASVLGLGGGLTDPLQRLDPAVLPVYVAEEASGPERPRTLVLRTQQDDSTVGYTVLRERSAQLGDADLGALTDPTLTTLVGDLLSGRGASTAGALAEFGIRYVYLPAPADLTLVDSLDGQSGMVRASSPDGGAVWRVEGTTGRVRLLSDGQGAEQPVGVLVPSGSVAVDARIEQSRATRLVIAERPDPRWQATLDGQALTQVDGQDVLTFVLPSGVGQLEVDFRDPTRPALVAAQGAALLVVVLLMLPSLRRRDNELEDAVDLDDEPVATVLP